MRNSSAALSPTCIRREEGVFCSRKHQRGNPYPPRPWGRGTGLGQGEGGGFGLRTPMTLFSGRLADVPSLPPSPSAPRDSALISLRQGLCLFFKILQVIFRCRLGENH